MLSHSGARPEPAYSHSVGVTDRIRSGISNVSAAGRVVAGQCSGDWVKRRGYNALTHCRRWHRWLTLTARAIARRKSNSTTVSYLTEPAGGGLFHERG